MNKTVELTAADFTDMIVLALPAALESLSTWSYTACRRLRQHVDVFTTPNLEYLARRIREHWSCAGQKRGDEREWRLTLTALEEELKKRAGT